MKGKIVVVVILALVIGYLLMPVPVEEGPIPPGLGNIEFGNLDPGVRGELQDHGAYREGDSISVSFEIELPEGLEPGASYNVHEEFYNAWDDTVYSQEDWSLDPADYPSGVVEITREYSAEDLAPTEVEVAEYAIDVIITDPDSGEQLARRIAHVEIVGEEITGEQG